DFGAEYVVVHFPAPSLSDASGIGWPELRDIAWGSARSLADMSERHEMPIHIEGFGPGPFLSTDFLTEVCQSFPCLRYCFDTGHMHIAAQRDGVDIYQFAHELSPYVGSIHLWNSRSIKDYLTYYHIPVHPSQNPQEGWADIAHVLQLILSNNGSCRLILESGSRYPSALGGYDFRDGVELGARGY
ncbi:MAG: hypothetical protein NTU41_01250, partial [Chloroflexi bacterium]|nr:hypothetical protein [Chloroflexota bacterium]